MQQIGICSRSSQSCSECVLKHVARTTGIFSYYNTGLIFLTVIPAKESSHLKRMLNCQFPVRFPAKPSVPKYFPIMNILLFHPVAASGQHPRNCFFLHLLHHTRNTRKRQTKKPPEGHGHACPPCGFSCIHLVHADIRNPSLQLC